MRSGLLALMLLAAVGCTSTHYMRDAEPTPPPGPGETKVIVYRTAVLGGVDNFPVYDLSDDEGKLLGFTETDAYFEYRCEPGRHLFLTWHEGEAFIEAELAPGKTYYLQAWSKFGIVSSRPGFSPETPGSEEFRELQKRWSELRCRELVPDLGAEFEKDHAERVRKSKAAWAAGVPKPKLLPPEAGEPTP